MWDQDRNPDFDWKLRGLYDHIHAIRPACLVGNNHHLVPFEGEDIQIFERDLPGREHRRAFGAGRSAACRSKRARRWNGMGGYKITDLDYKSSKTLIHYLVRAAGCNGNLLLTIGPSTRRGNCSRRPSNGCGDGRMARPVRRKHLRDPRRRYPAHDWGVTDAQRRQTLCACARFAGRALYLQLAERVKSARCLNNGERVKFDTPGEKGSS